MVHKISMAKSRPRKRALLAEKRELKLS
jgi:hypothetical protein